MSPIYYTAPARFDSLSADGQTFDIVEGQIDLAGASPTAILQLTELWGCKPVDPAHVAWVPESGATRARTMGERAEAMATVIEDLFRVRPRMVPPGESLPPSAGLGEFAVSYDSAAIYRWIGVAWMAVPEEMLPELAAEPAVVIPGPRHVALAPPRSPLMATEEDLAPPAPAEGEDGAAAAETPGDVEHALPRGNLRPPRREKKGR